MESTAIALKTLTIAEKYFIATEYHREKAKPGFSATLFSRRRDCSRYGVQTYLKLKSDIDELVRAGASKEGLLSGNYGHSGSLIKVYKRVHGLEVVR